MVVCLSLSVENSDKIRIYSTTIPATNRLYCLMHDPVYRLSQVVEPMRNLSPPHPGFYLGHGMSKPPVPPVPVFGSVALTNGVMSVAGTGGASRAEYRLLGTTNLALPPGAMDLPGDKPV